MSEIEDPGAQGGQGAAPPSTTPPPQPGVSPQDAWAAWVKGSFSKRYRARALGDALVAANQGASAEQIMAAARLGGAAAERNYYATSALVLGIITLVIAVVLNGVAILPAIFGVISGIRGINAERRVQAIVGLVLTGLAVLIGIALLASSGARR